MGRGRETHNMAPKTPAKPRASKGEALVAVFESFAARVTSLAEKVRDLVDLDAAEAAEEAGAGSSAAAAGDTTGHFSKEEDAKLIAQVEKEGKENLSPLVAETGRTLTALEARVHTLFTQGKIKVAEGKDKAEPQAPKSKKRKHEDAPENDDEKEKK